ELLYRRRTHREMNPREEPCLETHVGQRQHARSEALFYYFRLENQVPENPLLRLIDTAHKQYALGRSPQESARLGRQAEIKNSGSPLIKQRWTEQADRYEQIYAWSSDRRSDSISVRG